jgi:hypothetical protein
MVGTGFPRRPCTVKELVFDQLVELDMNAFAEPGVMTVTGGEQRLRLRRRLGLDPPFLGTRHQHRGVKDLRLRLRFELADG